MRLNKNIKSLLANGGVELTARWILGLVFIYASFHKIISPADFAKAIYGYDLFPNTLINLIAIVLPYVELVSGIALVTGIYPRSAALIIITLLFAFIVVLTINLVRGIEFDCGCFAFSENGYSNSAEISLIRNFILLGVGMYVFLYRYHRKGCLLEIRSFSISRKKEESI
jgi:uncharacterized membrane protein YphA (DoxX/SURF4 family)